jgi:erythromycin esterase-like protein
MAISREDAVRRLRRLAHPLTGAPQDYDSLLEQIGDASLVLLGEATHGTHEFYRERAVITKRLIEEKGFTAVAVEADWPDAYRVNRYVRGAPEDADAEESLGGFRRFPTWMWRNAEVLDFVGWLRGHNDARPADQGAGFYGLDLYSLHVSVDAVIDYLDRVDPAGADRARERYACFEHFGGEAQDYGRAVTLGISESCRDGVVEQLLDLHRNSIAYLRRDGLAAEDDQFYAEENARLVANAERYYRTMFADQASSWNLRDTHMADTLDALGGHLRRHGDRAKVVVWEHNSHIGDARRTEMGRRGEVNVGQLARMRHPDDAVLVGFTTSSGTVTAASAWDAPAERMAVRPAIPESYESLFHQMGYPGFLLRLAGNGVEPILDPRLERAIGVVYRPETERQGHYFAADISLQFDAVVHIDDTRAVEPLERTAGWELGEPPETYPSAL